MNVRIIADPRGQHFNRIKQTVNLINGVQRYFRLTVSEPPIALPPNGEPIDPAAVCQQMEGAILYERFILIVDQLFADRWFSHEYRRSAIITIGDWERLYAPPSLRSYIAYQIAQALFNFSTELSEEMALNVVHRPSKGCMLDMCVNKPDIKLGMVAGNICPECVAKAKQLGLHDEQVDSIERILRFVRAEATGHPLTFEPSEAFVVMRFTQNDENDNAYRYGIKLGLEDCNIRCVRADNRVESGQLLDKILRSLNRSRFVVAKVDENNINVFFELGLAMGLDKEVLLISEQTLILNLPSDLRNWECLTYQRGNFEQLRQAVGNFFRQNYVLQG